MNTQETQDSRIVSILINLDLNVHKKCAINQYINSKEGIKEVEKNKKVKSYRNLRSTLKECYLTGSLKYGNNFIY